VNRLRVNAEAARKVDGRQDLLSRKASGQGDSQRVVGVVLRATPLSHRPSRSPQREALRVTQVSRPWYGLTTIVLQDPVADKNNRIAVEVRQPPRFRTLSPSRLEIATRLLLISTSNIVDTSRGRGSGNGSAVKAAKAH
jgi:hypothetical protein